MSSHEAEGESWTGKLASRYGLPRGEYAKTYGAAALVNSVGRGIFFPFTVLFFYSQLRVPLGQIGLALMATAGLSSIAVGRTGAAIDRFGARNVVVALAVVRTAVLPTYLLVHHIWQFLLAATVVAIADRTDMAAGQVIVSSLAVEGDRTAWFGLSRLALNAGIGSGALLGGVLVTATGSYTWVVLGNSIGYLLVAALYLRLPSDDIGRKGGQAGKKGAWGDGLFLTLASFNGLLFLISLAIEIGLPIFLVLNLGQPKWTVSLVFVINTLMVTLFQLPVARAARERPALRVLAYALLAYAATFGIFLATRHVDKSLALTFVVLATVIFTTGELLASVTGMAVLNDAAPPDRLGSYIGVAHVFIGIGTSIAPVVYSTGLSHSPGWFWTALIVLATGMAVLSFLLQRPVATKIARQRAEAVPALVEL